MENLNDVMGWMQNNFDKYNGDLSVLAEDAAALCVKHKIVSGPLWTKIGRTTLKNIYRIRHLQKKRAAMLDYADPFDSKAWCSLIYLINNRYVSLKIMGKRELRIVAESYSSIVSNNSRERDFFYKLIQKVGDKKVGEVFTVEQIQNLRIKCGLSRKPKRGAK